MHVLLVCKASQPVKSVYVSHMGILWHPGRVSLPNAGQMLFAGHTTTTCKHALNAPPCPRPAFPPWGGNDSLDLPFMRQALQCCSACRNSDRCKCYLLGAKH